MLINNKSYNKYLYINYNLIFNFFYFIIFNYIYKLKKNLTHHSNIFFLFVF